MVKLLLVLTVVCGLAVRVTPTRLAPGQTRQFDYNGDRYWVMIDWWGTVNYQKAVDDCKTLHDAEVTDLYSDDQYQEIQSEVEGAIPGTWNEVMLWTSESDAPDTKVMLVIWRPGTGGPNTKKNLAPSYAGHGYICKKQMNPPGTTYHFTYDGDEYWYDIDWWGTYDYATSEARCAEHDALLVTIFDEAQLAEIEKQVEYRIPLTWNEVMLWTANSDKAGTHSMLVIWRPGTGGPNRKEDQEPTYKGHGYVCQKRDNKPGTTYEFQYDHDDYWFNIDWWGTYDLATSEAKCAEHDAKLVQIIDDAQLSEIEKQVKYRIPTTWNEVMLWTGGSVQPGTNVMLVIWRQGTGGPDRTENQPGAYKGHGYVCQKKTNAPGTTYSYEFSGSEYYLYINYWGQTNYADSVTACAGHGATVASAADDAVYEEMKKQIEYRIPLTWRDVVMWTSDSDSPGTHVMLVVFRDGTGGPDRKESHLDSYGGHGYVCSKTL